MLNFNCHWRKGRFKTKRFLPIGKLNAHESDFSSLVFSIPLRRKEEVKAANKLLEYIEENKPINQVEANLRGDQAKISWLLQAMKKVANPTDKPNGKAVNEKLGQFIFDSSKAEEVFKDISPNSEEWNRVKKNEMLKLNDSQRKAILSALHARDLCLLQGPPGTGKTTVIAELIWQLISQDQKQKVLLTSETNLAVDNAIEKLLNKEHTLVKPLRFGKDTKFEEEGKKYSFNRIMKWIDEKFVPPDYVEDSLEEKDDEEEINPDNPYNNAVQIWMNRIAEKSHREINPKYSEALKDWAIELTQPETEIKSLFKSKYFKYANVVGSTCSSSGSRSFTDSYQFIFNTKPEFLREPDKPWNRIPVEFEAVIMDEASKATPPEMLLPLCFAKKSIVIGDHKQLPPMLNEKEFKEALSELKDERAKKLAEEIDKEFVETSQFERLIMNPKVSKTIAARLNIQYRMHPKINNVIKQFYTGDTDEGLEPAQELIEHSESEDLNNPFSRHHGFWNDEILSNPTFTPFG
jgi:DNA polymerase III delta prime subunit